MTPTPPHSVCSVLSVVKNWNHRLHGMHSCLELRLAFGDQMNALTDELIRELIA